MCKTYQLVQRWNLERASSKGTVAALLSVRCYDLSVWAIRTFNKPLVPLFHRRLSTVHAARAAFCLYDPRATRLGHCQKNIVCIESSANPEQQDI